MILTQDHVDKQLEAVITALREYESRKAGG
jgi:hypothetical protein